MTEDYSEYIYTVEDIDKAFDMGYVSAVEEFESLIDHIHDMQKRLLQTMKDITHEEKDSSVMENHDQCKIMDFQSVLKK